MARAAAQPDAALFKPEEEIEVQHAELAVRALLEAGWSEADIEHRNEGGALCPVVTGLDSFVDTIRVPRYVEAQEQSRAGASGETRSQ